VLRTEARTFSSVTPSAGKNLQERLETKIAGDKDGLPPATNDSANTLEVRLAEVLDIREDGGHSLVIVDMDRRGDKFWAVQIILLEESKV